MLYLYIYDLYNIVESPVQLQFYLQEVFMSFPINDQAANTETDLIPRESSDLLYWQYPDTS